jgi:hypothetical protein
MDIRPPADRPCGSCPYRRDVPSGVWAEEEYEKLPAYDGETFEQPIGVFHCHRQDGRACAGWVAVHDMYESLALRLASAEGRVDVDGFLDYETDVPLFGSGAEAAEHGLRDLEEPDADARRVMKKLRSS